MNKKILYIVVAVIALLIIGGGYFLWMSDHQKTEKLTTFAQCIKKSGALFYGAFWCPHCQAQKAEFQTLFGSADTELPYVECSTPDSNGQLDVCTKAGIKAYPTWKFADGTTGEGALTLQQLADKTGCKAPN